MMDQSNNNNNQKNRNTWHISSDDSEDESNSSSMNPLPNPTINMYNQHKADALVQKKNKADRYDLPKQSTWFFSTVLICTIAVMLERFIIVFDGMGEKHEAFLHIEIFSCVLLSFLCCGMIYTSFVYLTRVNVYMLYNYCIMHFMLLAYNSLYIVIPSARCSQNDNINNVCPITFYILLVFTGIIIYFVYRIHEDMAWLFFKRVGALPKMRRLYSTYLLVRSSTSLNVICALLITTSTWKFTVLNKVDLGNIIALIIVTLALLATEYLGRYYMKFGIENEDKQLVQRSFYLSLFLPIYTIYSIVVGVSAWENRFNAVFTVTSAEKAAEEGEKTNDYGVHYANEILFGIALSVFLGIMVFIMRIRTFLKMKYLQANFGQGLPEKVLNDNFFFTVYDLLPLLERFRPNKHISSGKLKARQRENDKLEADDDGSFKIRTVSGTNLIDVKIDTDANKSPAMNGAEDNKKIDNDYLLM